MLWGGSPGTTNAIFKNNIIHTLVDHHIDTGTGAGASLTGWTIDYNSYYPDGATAFRYPHPTQMNFADWKTASSQDANSTVADPVLDTSTFKLGAGSPCINAGIDWGQTGDFEGKPKFGPAWDIGAYEFWIYGNAFSGGMKMTTKHFISDN